MCKSNSTSPSDAARERAHNQARVWRKLHYLTRGRIDILRAVEVAAEEEAPGPLRAALETIRGELRDGRELSEAMRKAGGFSASVLELVRSAERSGAWEDILPIVAKGLEDETFEAPA